MAGEYNNRDTNSMMSRNAKLSVQSPFGSQSVSSGFDFELNNFFRTNNELIIDGVRSTMTGRYSLGSGEFTLDTPYIRYGEVKTINIKVNHDASHVDATVTWAPSKQVSLH